MSKHSEWGVREAAMMALGRLAQHGQKYLLERWTSFEPNSVAWNHDTLQDISREAIPQTLVMFDHSDPDVRQAAIEVFLELAQYG
jgi:hypothetical protein